MATTVNSIFDRVEVVLQDSKATRWPRAENLVWLNDGLRDLAVLKPDTKVRRVEITLAAGAKQALPDDGILLEGVIWAGQTVTPCVKGLLDSFSPGWMNKPAKTVQNFMYSPLEPKIFFVYPAQTDNTVKVEVTYSSYPDEAHINGILDCPDKYATRLVDYVLFRSYSKDAEFAGSAGIAAAYYQSFVK